MSTELLEQELERQVARAESLHVDELDGTVANYVRQNPYATHDKAFSVMHSFGRYVHGALIKDDRFNKIPERGFDSGHGSGSLRMIEVAIALLRVAIVDGVENAVQWLTFVEEQQVADAFVITAVWGVAIEAPLAITDEISIWPFADLPDSATKRKLMVGAVNEFVHTPFDYESPRCAVLHATKITHLRPTPRVQGRDGAESNPAPQLERYTKLQKLTAISDQVIPLLGVFGPQVSLPAMTWVTFADQRLERFKVSSTRQFRRIEVIPDHLDEMPPLTHAEVAPLVSAFLKLPAAVRGQLAVALERLSLAVRRHDPADKAVELSIALESLLSDKATNDVSSGCKLIHRGD